MPRAAQALNREYLIWFRACRLCHLARSVQIPTLEISSFSCINCPCNGALQYRSSSCADPDHDLFTRDISWVDFCYQRLHILSLYCQIVSVCLFGDYESHTRQAPIELQKSCKCFGRITFSPILLVQEVSCLQALVTHPIRPNQSNHFWLAFGITPRFRIFRDRAKKDGKFVDIRILGRWKNFQHE